MISFNNTKIQIDSKMFFFFYSDWLESGVLAKQDLFQETSGKFLSNQEFVKRPLEKTM